MKNLGSSSETLDVYFPLGIQYEDSYYDLVITDFQVWVNNQPVKVEQKQFLNEKSPSGKSTSAAFRVSFPTDRDTQIHVMYTIGSKFVSGAGRMESIAYIFETGSGWNGDIGKAVLTVNLLDESSQDSVVEKPDNGKMDGRSITWTWTNFEPAEEDNFLIVLVDPQSWKEVVAARQQVEQNPRDGAAWTYLGKLYLNLASGKVFISYSYFAKLAKLSLEKAIQLSPYDREPHYQLFSLYRDQTYKFWGDPLSQKECDSLVSEMNQFLLRTSSDEYDLKDIPEYYEQMSCPNKPKLTTQRGIFPTLTASPTASSTVMPTEYPFAEETISAFMKTRNARNAPSETPSPARTSTYIKIASNTPIPSGTWSLTSTPQLSLSSTYAGNNWQGVAVITLLGTAGIGIFFLWRHFRRK